MSSTRAALVAAASAESSAQRALNASAVSLLIAVGCVALFLPPLAARTVDSVLWVAGTSALLAVAVLLHWIFIGIAARRMERSVAGWVSMSVALFPVGGAAALILLNWLADESPESPESRAGNVAPATGWRG